MAKKVKFGASGKPKVSAARLRKARRSRKKSGGGGASGSGGGKGSFNPNTVLDW